jgi:hypothetical protein
MGIQASRDLMTRGIAFLNDRRRINHDAARGRTSFLIDLLRLTILDGEREVGYKQHSLHLQVNCCLKHYRRWNIKRITRAFSSN